MLALAFLAACSPAKTVAPVASPPVTADPPVACDAKIYVRGSQGPLPVYASPSHDAPVGALPVHEVEGARGGPIVHLSGAAADGWFRYDSIEAAEPSSTDPPPPPAGWVRSPHLAVDLAMSEVNPALMEPWHVRLRAEPSSDASVGRSYVQEAHEARVLACQGTWLKVEVTLDGAAPATGWLAEYDHCGNPFTTCARSRPEE